MIRTTLAAAIVFAASAGLAHADDEIVRGSVVKVEQQEIYVSLGSKQGVVDGAPLRIKRTVKLKHPITRAPVEDWVPVGVATVTQSGGTLSRAVVGELVGDLKIGDIVEVLVDRPDVARPTQPPVTPPVTPSGPAPDPATVEVLGIFAQQTGQTLDARIAGWERYLSTRGGSPFAEGIRRDVDLMRNLRDQMRPTGAPQGTEVVATAQHNARTSAAAGASIPVIFLLDQPDRVASAYLHYRPRGARTYRRMLLVREHEIYLRGAIPAEAVATPGVDYFVEVSTPSGQAGLALASPAEPIAITVTPPPLTDRFGAKPGTSSVKLAIDYLDYATFDKRTGDRTDHQVTANVDFIYSLGGAVQSVGVGYGVFSGAGGYKDRTYTDDDPVPRSGFHYGYADVEVGGKTDHVALSGGAKLIAGVGKEKEGDIGGGGFGMGIEGRFRIGRRDATNLLFAANTISQIGFLTDIRFGARPLHDLMIGISVGATDRPNRGDVGVKLATELEWIGFRNVSLIFRGSWQGRDVDHGGIGGGGGLGFYW